MEKLQKEIMADAIKECIELNKTVKMLNRILGFSLVVNMALIIGLIVCMIGI